jgi:hypothetical protein
MKTGQRVTIQLRDPAQVIRDPAHKGPGGKNAKLPTEPTEVAWSVFWARRLADGSIIIVKKEG